MNRMWVLFWLSLAALLVFGIAPFVGSERIPFRAIWTTAQECTDLGDNYAKVDILWKLRIPRVLLAFMAGASLATSGMIFQSIFRHPLATPFTLGVSHAAALGSCVSVQQGWGFFVLLGISSVSLAAIGSAGAAVLLIGWLATRDQRGTAVSVLLLIGVALASLFASITLVLQYVSNANRYPEVVRLIIGGLEGVVGFRDALDVFPFMATGCLLAWYLAHSLNALSVSDEFAFGRGVDLQHTKGLLLFAAVIMVGAVVAVCGPIGFVGLIVPCGARVLVGADHRFLLPATWLCGGIFLVVCDSVARLAVATGELPVGILTALLGAPFFLYILLTHKRTLGTVR